MKPPTSYFVLQGNGVRLARVAQLPGSRGQYRRTSKKTGRPETRVEVFPPGSVGTRAAAPKWVDNRLLFVDHHLAYIAWNSAGEYARRRGTTMSQAIAELSRAAGPKEIPS